jgi:nanoRNase/pAp phosphatase (c-di-AMP/oligoRNAs hydrolase)
MKRLVMIVQKAKRDLEDYFPENERMTSGFARHTPIRERYHRLMQIVHPDDRVAVIINPDPDSIASAMALKRLFWRKTKSTFIYHINPIQRQDNLTLLQILNVSLTPSDLLDEKEITKYAIVDSQPGHNKLFQKYSFDIIVDHHPLYEQTRAPFVDVRPEYGATSTIFTEYLRSGRIKPSTPLATALFYGIKTDTNNLVGNAQDTDINAFRYLFKFANIHAVKKIESSEITKKSLEYYKRAMDRLRFWKGIAYTHLGNLGNPDACVQIADFFLKLSEASWSIVSGVYGGTLVVIFRNHGFGKDAGKVAHRLFGKFGKAGGHKAAARAEIEVKDLKPYLHSDEEVDAFVFRQIKKLSPRA